MALRTFFAVDNEAFTQVAGNPGGTAGDAIINNSDTPNGWIFEYQGGAPQTIELNDTRQRSRFNDDEPGDHVITDGGSLVANGTEVESESVHVFEELDSSGNPTGNTVNVWVFSKGGVTQDIWGIGFDEPLKPGVQYVKLSGSNDGTSRYNRFVPCFCSGTPILTVDGWVNVEELRPGDRIWTRDADDAVIRWVGTTETDGSGDMAPIRVGANVFGNHGQVFISPRHRVLVEDYRLELLTGHEAALIPAKHLVGINGIGISPRDRVSYVHFMLGRHAVVNSNGLLSESFFPGDVAIKGLARETKRELFALFPELESGEVSSFASLAAPCLSSVEATAFRGAFS
jgi:hypothetical protein